MLRRFAAPVRTTVAPLVLPQQRTIIIPVLLGIMVSDELEKRARQALQHAPQKDRFFLIDNSAAMSLRQVRNALETARDKKMRDKDRVAVVTFGARGVAWAVPPQYVKTPVSRPTCTINGDLVSLNSDLLQCPWGCIEAQRPWPALWDAFDMAFTQPIRPNTDFVVVTAQSQTADQPKAAAIRKQLTDLNIKLHLIHIVDENAKACEAYRQLCSNGGDYWCIEEADIRNTIQNIV